MKKKMQRGGFKLRMTKKIAFLIRGIGFRKEQYERKKWIHMLFNIIYKYNKIILMTFN